MIKKLFPILLALIGVGGGIGAGLALKPGPEEMAAMQAECPAQAGPDTSYAATTEGEGAEEGTEQEYVKLNNQFVIPVVGKEMVDSLVVMSLSIEVEPGFTETVYAREPKLRDGFLQVLFDHANMGGFQGEFTNSSNLDVLRASLREVAQSVIGAAASNVLITDIARQDL
ncbi:Flagellar synthesis associated protein Pden_2118 [hydrothermal vent metagenome]|uniref:Flagellar synthesis associated protein Pden_2118 n=1 Tax=hydrothermal vent metagenome TaxID=652676 RepID=A0A3B0RZ63_9ZZZZ